MRRGGSGLEHYTQMLLFLMWISLLTEVLIVLADSAKVNTILIPSYCVIVAVWTTAKGELWKRRNAELAHEWDATDFEADEPPRAEFLRSFISGPWAPVERGGLGAMQRRRGFYARGDAKVFVPYEEAPEVLVMDGGKRLRSSKVLLGRALLPTMFVMMLSITLSILTFRMLMSFGAGFEDNKFANAQTASLIGGTLNAVWITMVNMLYRKIGIPRFRGSNPEY